MRDALSGVELGMTGSETKRIEERKRESKRAKKIAPSATRLLLLLLFPSDLFGSSLCVPPSSWSSTPRFTSSISKMFGAGQEQSGKREGRKEGRKEERKEEGRHTYAGR